MTSQQHNHQPAGYQVRVRGHLGATMQRAFPTLQACRRGHDTLLQGIPDQAALHGVLARIEALRLDLLEVRRPPETNPDATAGREVPDE
ncbi:MAG TPA: hypothetical protein VGM53_35020 [Streptosporangiaceae bacterium]|jgi:hypothetical protein